MNCLTFALCLSAYNMLGRFKHSLAPIANAIAFTSPPPKHIILEESI